MRPSRAMGMAVKPYPGENSGRSRLWRAAISISPAMAASAPPATSTKTYTSTEFIPPCRAASGLAPTKVISKPSRVLRSST